MIKGLLQNCPCPVKYEAIQIAMEKRPVLLQANKFDLYSFCSQYQISKDALDAFLEKEGKPPGCYERKCWWLKEFEHEFGKAAADGLQAKLFG